AVRVPLAREQRHQVDDVHHAHAQLRQVAAQPIGGRNGLQRGDVAGTAEDYVRFFATVVARPVPDRGAAGAVFARGIHVEPLQLRLLVDHDQVHVVAAAQAVVADGEQ